MTAAAPTTVLGSPTAAGPAGDGSGDSGHGRVRGGRLTSAMCIQQADNARPASTGRRTARVDGALHGGRAGPPRPVRGTRVSQIRAGGARADRALPDAR